MRSESKLLEDLLVDVLKTELKEAVPRVTTPARAKIGKLAEEAARAAAAPLRRGVSRAAQEIANRAVDNLLAE
jgi:hypothetical protein